MALHFARFFAVLYLLALFFAGQPTAPAFAFAGPFAGLLALCFFLAHMGRKGRA